MKNLFGYSRVLAVGDVIKYNFVSSGRKAIEDNYCEFNNGRPHGDGKRCDVGAQRGVRAVPV